MQKQTKFLRTTAVFLAFNMLTQCIFPTVVYALTGGPNAPEFSSFEPVATTDMVNLFSGEFSYNLPVLQIPGPDGGGYALSLSYDSGTHVEEEASWVGYGWKLNPGSVNRNVSGFPDDYRDVPVVKYNKNFPNWTSSYTKQIGMEIFSKKKAKVKGQKPEGTGNKPAGQILRSNLMGLTNSTTLRYSRKGFQWVYGSGIGVMGMANINLETDELGNVTYRFNVNPLGIINKVRKKGEKEQKDKQEIKTDKEKKRERLEKSLKEKAQNAANSNIIRSFSATYGYFFPVNSLPTHMTKFSGASFNWNTGLQATFTNAPVGVNTGARVNFNYQETTPEELYKSYGYMYNPGGPVGDNQDILRDYSVEKPNDYNQRNLMIGIPFSNIDQYTLAGEGLSGSFRFHHNHVGHYYPNFVTNNYNTQPTGFDLSGVASLGVGFTFGVGFNHSEVGTWLDEGDAAAYKYTNQVPSDDPRRPDHGIFRFTNDMGGSMEYAPTDVFSSNLERGFRIKPSFEESLNPQTLQQKKEKYATSSYIAYHTHQDIQNAGNSTAYLFNKNLDYATLPGRNAGQNPHGIAEVSVHNPSGLHYVYGQPVYARNETNLQVHVNQNNASIENNYLAYLRKPLRLVPNQGNYLMNQLQEYDVLMGEIRTVPYATNYLLTEITTPDYVDVNQNGADREDFGGWTAFAYHQKYGHEQQNWYRWRSPYTGLFYSQNSISDPKDDLGSLMTGEKEVYYLKWIETKSHIAFFVTNDSGNDRWNAQELANKMDISSGEAAKVINYLQGSGISREDGLSAALLSSLGDEAASSKEAKGTQTPERLEKIVLFSKNAPEHPLVTVRMEHDYSLVPNVENSSNHTGKLTLKKVWFEYEGVIPGRVSPYEFDYTYKPGQTYQGEGKTRMLRCKLQTCYSPFPNYTIVKFVTACYSYVLAILWIA